MTATTSHPTAASIAAGVQTIQTDIQRTTAAVDVIDPADRIDIHNQLDVLTQRTGTLVRELQQMQASDDPAVRDAIRQHAAAELDELQQAVKQVAERVDRQAPQTTSGR